MVTSLEPLLFEHLFLFGALHRNKTGKTENKTGEDDAKLMNENHTKFEGGNEKEATKTNRN